MLKRQVFTQLILVISRHFLCCFSKGSEALIYSLIFGKYAHEIELIKIKKGNRREAIALNNLCE